MKAPKSKKARKHDENGMTSMPIDEMPLERSSDASPDSLCDVLKQFEKHIQVKENTDESLKELQGKVAMLEKKVEMLENKGAILEKKVEMLENKGERNKSKEVQMKVRMKKLKEDFRTELNDFKEKLQFEFYEQIKRKLEENIGNKSSPCLSMLKEDLKKEPEEVKDELGLGIQEDMKKQGWNKVHDYNESPSLRSHPHQSQTIKFKLSIPSQVDQVVYKGKPIRTDDNDCEHITVVLYDGDNPIAPDHPLASAVVQLVLIDGDFDSTHGFWSKDDFEKKITIRGSNPNLVKNGKFKLAGGKCHHKGVTITDNSNRKDVMLGVMIMGDTEERVLEGLSNIFRVQEPKTERDRGKRNADDSTEDLLRYTTGQVPVPNKKGQGQRCNLPTTRPNFSGMVNPSHPAYNVSKANKRYDSGPVGSLMVSGLTQQGTDQLENCAQGQQYQTTGQGQHYQAAGPMLDFMNVQTQSQITYRPTAGQGRQHNSVMPTFAGMHQQRAYVHAAVGNVPRGESVVEHALQQNSTQQGVQLDNHGHSLVDPLQGSHLQQQYATQQGGPQLDNYRNGSVDPLHVGHLHHYATQQGHGSVDPLQVSRLHQYTTQQGHGSVDPLQVGHSQQYATQQGTKQLDNYRQGRQHNSGIPTQLNSALMSNVPQREYLPQQNTTQQGVQLQNHGLGQQHNSVMQTFPAMLPQGPYVHAATGNGPGGEPIVQRVPQQNDTQQGVQLNNSGSDMGLDLNNPTGLFAGHVFDNSTMDETLRHLNCNVTAPDDPKLSGLLHNAVAADQGGPSAGSQWSTSQMHMDYSAGMQLSGFHPPTEDVGSIVTGPRTAAPAPEVTHMDFTQPTPPGLGQWEQ